MNSNEMFTGVGVAAMPRTHRAVAALSVAAAHIAYVAPAPAAAIPTQRKRRAATAATSASVKRGTT
jgi:hypothetical protein